MPVKCDYSRWIAGNNPDTEPFGEECTCKFTSSNEIKGKTASSNSITLSIIHIVHGWQKVHASSVAVTTVAVQRKFSFSSEE